jgi:hypothetical protein
MAKKKSFNEDLFERLRATGLRKRTARVIAESTDGRKQPAKAVRGVIDDLRGLAAEVEDRASGKSSKRSAAAKKAVQTRKRKARARSQAAKKGAKTRAGSRS